MAWETRGGGRYYYAKRREGQRVVSEYRGTGFLAEAIATLAQADADRLAAEREGWQREVAEQAALDAEIDDLAQLVQTVIRAALLVSGCHRHKRQWRVRREHTAD